MNHLRESSHKTLIGHLAFLVVGIITLGAIYLYFQNTSSVMLGGIALVLVHIAVVGGVFFLGRRLLVNLIQKLPTPHTLLGEED